MPSIEFTEDAVYQSGNWPSFKAGQVVSAADLKKTLALDAAPSADFAFAWLNRWVQRGAAKWATPGITPHVVPDLEPAADAAPMEEPAEAPKRRGRPPKAREE